LKYIIFILFATISILYAAEPIDPIPQQLIYNLKKAKIGKNLFFDTILAKDRTISCSSCHDINHGGDDGKKVSDGVFSRKTDLNSPTVLNSIFNFKQFWNGRANTIQEQIDMTLHTKDELDMTKEMVISRINENIKYKKLFKEAYNNQKISYDMVIDSIFEYQKTLITPDSKFDRYLRGEISLSKDEEEGYTLFKKFGCIACHNGKNIGGNSFQQLGVMVKSVNCDGDVYSTTKKDIDKCLYKVPTLRNILLTKPYFHDGSAKNIHDAIKTMGYNNLGIEIENKNIEKIIKFFETLNGELSKDIK